jgi:hypothetical protein
MRIFAGLVFVLICSSATLAEDGEYMTLDDQGRLLVSGPFEVIIPGPPGFAVAGPVHKTEKFLAETLQVAKAGFFGDKQFVVVEVETTDAPAGTLSYADMPTVDLAGQEFRSRTLCIELTADDMEAGDEPLLTFIADQGFVVEPALYIRQLLFNTADGTGEAGILFAERVEDCETVSDEYRADFDQRTERFIKRVQDANPER